MILMTIWNIKRMNMYRCKKSTVPSDCDVDDDPIGPVKEKSRDIADFNIFGRDEEYNLFRIWKIQVQKKKIKGYCHEKLSILELGGVIFYLFSECRSFVREYG